MIENTLLTRRQTLACLGAATMLAVCRPPKVQASRQTKPGIMYDRAFLARLLDVLDQQAQMNNALLFTPEGRCCITEIFQRLNPGSHLEAAIIAAISGRAELFVEDRQCKTRLLEIISEYILRKDRAISGLPDHPLLDCPGLGLPDTYRLLLFREQVTGLMQTLTGASLHRAEHMRWKFISDLTLGRNHSDSRTSKQMATKYPNLSKSDIDAILWNINAYRTLFGPSYAWASTMVSRAERDLLSA